LLPFKKIFIFKTPPSVDLTFCHNLKFQKQTRQNFLSFYTHLQAFFAPFFEGFKAKEVLLKIFHGRIGGGIPILYLIRGWEEVLNFLGTLTMDLDWTSFISVSGFDF